jgi:serine-type D-Ala-D-Ala carboxypeptidase
MEEQERDGSERLETGPLADTVRALLAATPPPPGTLARTGSTAPTPPGTAPSDPPPGVVLAVRSAAGTQYAAGGWAQTFDERGPLDAPVPMALDTRIDLGSVTKIVATTTSVMALVERRHLRLDTRVDAVLPWMHDRPAGEATIADLLMHRAGLWEWWPLYLDASDAEAALDRASTLPLRYAPRRGRHYSDLGFQLLGAVIAQVTGSGLPEAVDALCLRPFALDTTRYATPVAGAAAVATSLGDRIEREMVTTGRPYPVTGDAEAYAGWRTQVLVGQVNDGNAFHAYAGAAGHAGLFSTVPDLLRYGQILLDCLDGTGPIGASTVRRFLQPGLDAGQVLGFRTWTPHLGGRRTSAFGHTGFPGVGLVVVPASRAVVALSTNRLHASAPRATEEMLDAALAAAGAHLYPTAVTQPQNKRKTR